MWLDKDSVQTNRHLRGIEFSKTGRGERFDISRTQTRNLVVEAVRTLCSAVHVKAGTLTCMLQEDCRTTY